ncbi:hypothetical protein [Myxosarcina sp. GI1]|uniref:hypothetical protein n=1 Tax=Myxosarcina sp. GI1 TaxID=1541065 RepID=UPI00056D8A4A|nr:hypothetical protein [Myxosarcina sp. GI1]
MKIVLDIDKLLLEGRITREEYERLKKFASEETGSLALNILIGFGVIAVVLGALALLPSSVTAIAIGIALLLAGIFLRINRFRDWKVLRAILLLVGAILASGGILALTEGSILGYLLTTILCLIGSVYAQSNLLVIIATLSLSATVGAMTGYMHAVYFLSVRQPTLTILLFSLLSWGSYQLSFRIPRKYQPLTITFSRTSIFLVNLGFWVGSLWGDSLWRLRTNWSFRSGEMIPDWIFVVSWALGILIVGIWAAKQGKRWVVNLLMVFGAIHFYTQYFERLGASPMSLLFAGFIALGIVIAVDKFNRELLS